jgi:hypothetical protein
LYNIFSILQSKIVLVDTRAHSDYVQVIRCDIEMESVERSEMLKMGPFQEKAREIPYATFSNTANIFLRMKMAF